MKTQRFLLSGLLGIALAGVVLTGCHKSSTTPDTDYTAAEDETNATAAMNDTKNVSDNAMQGNSNQYGPEHGVKSIYTINCNVSWSHDTGVGVDTLYVTFGNGTSPVLCNDGRYRQGTILVYWNNSTGNLWQTYFDSAASITMTFRNYAAGNSSSNMIGVTGSRTWTNLGLNALLEQNWKFTANLTLTYPSGGGTATWNSTRTNTLVQPGGTGTAYYYEITGYASGVSRKGVNYTITITSPLYVTALPWWPPFYGCKWIESGTVSINRSSSSNTLYISFGTLGSCDDQAVATLNGVNYTFSMW